jgi:DNA-binding MarR family transcriptional regulator
MSRRQTSGVLTYHHYSDHINDHYSDDRDEMMVRRSSSSEPDRPIEIVSWAGGAPIRRVPIALARRFVQICMGVAAETLQEVGLVPLEYGVVAYLGDEPGLDQSALAQRLGTDRNTTSVLVDKLETKGLIARRVNGADRRAKLLNLTPRGEALHEKVRPAMRASQRRILSVLAPAERDAFLNQLIRIIKANESYARPGLARRKAGLSSSTAA